MKYNHHKFNDNNMPLTYKELEKTDRYGLYFLGAFLAMFLLLAHFVGPCGLQNSKTEQTQVVREAL